MNVTFVFDIYLFSILTQKLYCNKYVLSEICWLKLDIKFYYTSECNEHCSEYRNLLLFIIYEIYNVISYISYTLLNFNSDDECKCYHVHRTINMELLYFACTSIGISF